MLPAGRQRLGDCCGGPDGSHAGQGFFFQGILKEMLQKQDWALRDSNTRLRPCEDRTLTAELSAPCEYPFRDDRLSAMAKNVILRFAHHLGLELRRYSKPPLVALIDEDDFEKVRNLQWRSYRHRQSGDYYVIATGANRKDIRLHRLVMDAPDGMVVDHIWHNTLDNRKSQLRVCTNQVNTLNHRGPNRDNVSSGIRGVNAVSYDPTRFQARVKVHGKSQYLGVYGSKEEAAAAVIRKLDELGVPHD